MSLPTLTTDQIENLSEGQGLDFKSRLDLTDGDAIADLTDDVVAMLNRGPGRILIGVEERKGAFHSFRPYTDDPDKARLRLQSALLDNILPRPLDVDVVPIPLESGYLLDVQVPEHRRRPYQNRPRGAFKIRTGARNQPLSLDEIRGLGVDQATYEADLARFTAEQVAAIARRGKVQVDAPTLQISILPFEHYSRSLSPFDRGHGRLKNAPTFESRAGPFEGCDGGMEARVPTFDGLDIERLFIGDSWFVHTHIAHPIRHDTQRVDLYQFKDALAAYLQALEAFFIEEGLKGPFCLQIALEGLDRTKMMSWGFRGQTSVRLPYPAMVDTVAAPDILEAFAKLVRRASVYQG